MFLFLHGVLYLVALPTALLIDYAILKISISLNFISVLFAIVEICLLVAFVATFVIIQILER